MKGDIDFGSLKVLNLNSKNPVKFGKHLTERFIKLEKLYLNDRYSLLVDMEDNKLFYLRNKKMKKITSKYFKNNLDLIFVYLQSNQIETIGNNSFSSLTNLKYLCLSDNLLTKISTYYILLEKNY